MTTAHSQRISVTIDAPGVGAPLAAEEALRQLLDVFELLSAAGGDEASPVLWRLVDISKRNPVTMIAEAVSKVPGFDVNSIARREKRLIFDAIAELTTSRTVPIWMDRNARQRAQSLFRRNTEGIGLTSIAFSDDADDPKAVIVDKVARIGIATIDNHEKSIAVPYLDRSRIEIGSIDGVVISARDYRGRPALSVREKFSGEEIICVISDELFDKLGDAENLNTVWKHANILVRGELKFNRDGNIERVLAFRIERIVPPKSLIESEIADPNFTDGLGESEYLSNMRRIDGA